MTCMVLACTPRQRAVRCLTTSAGKKSIVGIRPSNRSGADTSSVETLSTGLQPVERFMRQPLAYYAVVELSASINPELVTDIMSVSRFVTCRGYVVHCDLMPRDSAKLAPLVRGASEQIEHLPASPGLPAPACALSSHQAGTPSKTEFPQTLAICNVASAMTASAMTHVQTQR